MKVRVRVRAQVRVSRLDLRDAMRAPQPPTDVDHEQVARELRGELRHLIEGLLAHLVRVRLRLRVRG